MRKDGAFCISGKKLFRAGRGRSIRQVFSSFQPADAAPPRKKHGGQTEERVKCRMPQGRQDEKAGRLLLAGTAT